MKMFQNQLQLQLQLQLNVVCGRVVNFVVLTFITGLSLKKLPLFSVTRQPYTFGKTSLLYSLVGGLCAEHVPMFSVARTNIDKCKAKCAGDDRCSGFIAVNNTVSGMLTCTLQQGVCRNISLDDSRTTYLKGIDINCK